MAAQQSGAVGLTRLDDEKVRKDDIPSNRDKAPGPRTEHKRKRRSVRQMRSHFHHAATEKDAPDSNGGAPEQWIGPVRTPSELTRRVCCGGAYSAHG